MGVEWLFVMLLVGCLPCVSASWGKSVFRGAGCTGSPITTQYVEGGCVTDGQSWYTGACTASGSVLYYCEDSTCSNCAVAQTFTLTCNYNATLDISTRYDCPSTSPAVPAPSATIHTYFAKTYTFVTGSCFPSVGLFDTGIGNFEKITCDSTFTNSLLQVCSDNQCSTCTDIPVTGPFQAVFEFSLFRFLFSLFDSQLFFKNYYFPSEVPVSCNIPTTGDQSSTAAVASATSSQSTNSGASTTGNNQGDDHWTGTWLVSGCPTGTCYCCPVGNATVAKNGLLVDIIVDTDDCGKQHFTGTLSSSTATSLTFECYAGMQAYVTVNPSANTAVISGCGDAEVQAMCASNAIELPTGPCNTKIADDNAVPKYCGWFGDPHLIEFDSSYHTCQSEGSTVLLENKYLLVLSDDVDVGDEINGAIPGATASAGITIIYKECNPQAITITSDGASNFVNPSDPQNVHRIFKQGTAFVFSALGTAIDVRSFGNTNFLSTSISTRYPGSGACSEGCPAGTEVNEAKRSFTPSTDAQAACAGLSGAFLSGCLYDVTITNITLFAQAANQSSAQFAEVQTITNFTAPTTGTSSSGTTSSATSSNTVSTGSTASSANGGNNGGNTVSTVTSSNPAGNNGNIGSGSTTSNVVASSNGEMVSCNLLFVLLSVVLVALVY